MLLPPRIKTQSRAHGSGELSVGNNDSISRTWNLPLFGMVAEKLAEIKPFILTTAVARVLSRLARQSILFTGKMEKQKSQGHQDPKNTSIRNMMRRFQSPMKARK